MPEGDTIARAARTLKRALVGRTVRRFESAYPVLTRVDVDAPIAGRTVADVTSRGKHLLIAFSGDLVLRTHMRMNGSWHVYKPGERWRRAAREMRVLIETDAYVAVAFNVPDAEFLTKRAAARHRVLRSLGPDLASAVFDGEEALRRLKARSSERIEDVLLDQRVVSGIGNVLKSETLFVAGIDPRARVAALDDARLNRLLDAAVRLMKMNVNETSTGAPPSGRRTTGSLDPEAKLWVYGRAGRPCRRCGAPIQLRRDSVDSRLTYWCPACQR
jgi:endonuclease-8